jgi:hypothetical protein
VSIKYAKPSEALLLFELNRRRLVWENPAMRKPGSAEKSARTREQLAQLHEKYVAAKTRATEIDWPGSSSA